MHPVITGMAIITTVIGCVFYLSWLLVNYFDN